MRYIYLSALFATFVCFYTTSAYAQSSPASKTPVLAAPESEQDINALSKAVVQIRTPNSTGSGSMVVYQGRLMVFTNRHVTEGHDSVEIAILKDVHEPAVPTFRGELRVFSAEYDLAVYEVNEDIEGRTVTAEQLNTSDNPWEYQLPQLEFIDADDVLSRGTPLALLGYPGLAGDELVYTAGIVSSVQMTDFNQKRMVAWYRTNAEMSPGNSGGIALTNDGRVIGIPTMVAMEERTGGRLGSILSIPLAFAVMQSDDLLTSWDDYYNPDDHLNPEGEPTYGQHTLAGSQLNLPLTAGGSRSASYLGELCTGYAAENPDATLTLREVTERLTIEFNASESTKDATMVVRAPDNSWHCNDDREAGNLNPGLYLEQAQPGDYQVWVGGYQPSDFFSGNVTAYSAGVETTTAEASGAFNLNGDPLYGTHQLSAFFLPDPHSIEVVAGGNVDISETIDGSGCTGFAAANPDVRMHFSGSTAGLKAYFVADNPIEDATIVINTPDGSWHCNDDAHGSTLNPMLDLATSGEGRYDIWIGSYRQGNYISGKLHFTEMSVEVP
ncbi:S1 family peptidase [Aliidiomarina soli]|uniref:Serine protease n=1 Tax=Aliidiomarina soli TaxID=1928574 RepID=A0A432WE30_9GAMM|nr:serine protease [Aliidiomarina soli]RUO31126.1 hypothetical protein CWE14_11565 [Aliidiomarina soli]